MKWIKAILIITAAVAASTLAMMVFMDSPLNSAAEARGFTINPGETAGDIGLKLKEHGFIRSQVYFLLVAETSGKSGELKSGLFDVSASMKTREILDYLTTATGKQKLYKVTVPEGFTARQIADRFEKNGLCSVDEFMGIVESPARHGVSAGNRRIDIENLEGLLFPETYFMDDNTNCRKMAQRMVDQFLEVFNPKLEARAKELGFSVLEAVTLASLIEKEVRVKTEGQRVSGVLHNRLRVGMLLQCDATIQYALPERKKKLYYKHLEIDSPYNTYVHKGLPPGPISNPGKNSIKAALYPEETKFYYYVARGDGSHIFSRSNNEHINAKQRIKREMRKKRIR